MRDTRERLSTLVYSPAPRQAIRNDPAAATLVGGMEIVITLQDTGEKS